MKKTVILFVVISCLFSTGCGVTQKGYKYDFADGYYYTTRPLKGNTTKVYVDNTPEMIHVYPAARKGGIDTSARNRLSFPQETSPSAIGQQYFRQASFDIDFLTFLFKYRPAVQNFPRQFNTNLNGGVYAGYRNDIYRLQYLQKPLNSFQQKTTHYGFSYGLFTGMGGTAMNPWVTNNNISAEYDGVLWTKGFAGIIGINNFTIGLAVGWDHLLDKNRRYWLYQDKALIGLAFGLNLN